MFDFPSTIDPAVRKHIESFYHSADAESTTNDWANHFTPDGIAKKSPDEVKGREALEKWIASTWPALESREHVVHRVYPYEDGKEEIMLHGSTLMNLKDGSKKTFYWTGRLKLVWTENGPLISRYIVVSDPTPPSEEMLAA